MEGCSGPRYCDHGLEGSGSSYAGAYGHGHGGHSDSLQPVGLALRLPEGTSRRRSSGSLRRASTAWCCYGGQTHRRGRGLYGRCPF